MDGSISVEGKQTTQKKKPDFLELSEDCEDEGEHAEQRGGEAELRALAHGHGACRGRCRCRLDLSAPGSIGVPEDGNGTGSRLTAILRSAMVQYFLLWI